MKKKKKDNHIYLRDVTHYQITASTNMYCLLSRTSLFHRFTFFHAESPKNRELCGTDLALL